MSERTKPTRTDMSYDDAEQKKLIIEALCRAYDPPPSGSDAPQGWSCVAHLVMHWLKHPETVPLPPEPPLRGLVFIEDDGTVRHATYRDT